MNNKNYGSFFSTGEKIALGLVSLYGAAGGVFYGMNLAIEEVNFSTAETIFSTLVPVAAVSFFCAYRERNSIDVSNIAEYSGEENIKLKKSMKGALEGLVLGSAGLSFACGVGYGIGSFIS